MRKVDYIHLSEVIRLEIDDLKKHPREHDEARITQCEFIARNFAARANIDREKFLAACGINSK